MTKEDFLKNVNPWGSHRLWLWNALEATKHLGLPVIELGSGPSSTPFLRQYCKDEKLLFYSYETSREWAVAMNSLYVIDWDAESFWNNPCGVCLLDLAPGEYRKVALMKLKAEIIVIHDSEPPGWNASDYQVRPLFKKFKYYKDDIPVEKGSPWTTALSNTIDVSQWT